jgi:polyisoprenyl-phosphate glycosyltransferase
MNTARAHQPADNLLALNLKSPHPDISCVLPAFNEEENIEVIIPLLAKQLQLANRSFELIIVDDGSTDRTIERATKLQADYPVVILRLSRNFGKENAITAGLEQARGSAVIILDADLQHPLHLLQRYIELWDEGYEMVYGVRQRRSDQSWILRNSSRLFYRLLSKATSVPIPRGAGDFRLLDRKVVDALNNLPERSRFMKGLYSWVGFKSHPVPFESERRGAGKSNFNFRGLFALAVTGITSFSNLPLRVWTGVGALISSLSILYALFIVGRTLIFGSSVPGWATLTVSILFLGGIQILSIGILGEYIGRIFEEVKGRPNYIVAEVLRPESTDA